MARRHHEELVVTAVEARSRLAELEAERGLAVGGGMGADDPYLVDLRQDIETWRAAFVGAAVTEIATLRAELFGAQVG